MVAQASIHGLLSSLLLPGSIAISILATMSTAAAIVSQSSSTLAIATRLHLGYASHPPPTSQLKSSLRSFSMMASVAGARYAVVAVDAGPKLEGYDFVKEIQGICNEMNETCENDSADAPAAQGQVSIDVLPVTPWGKFVPALNAIVGWSARRGASYLMLASAEVEITSGAVDVMKSHIMYSDDILVVGAALQGHTHYAPHGGQEKEVNLDGRTTPWNTLAMWNLPKLALTGFLLVSDGLHPDEDGREGVGGVEEVCTIATLQRILSKERAKAKLISIRPESEGGKSVTWGQDFGGDEQRREWHERKMRSKLTRAQLQLDLMGLSGKVIHC
mmetsp:Transcript_24153/g.45583  ORF Transcript_24153/g.45583 Transcript_24153/m.45583 type:complete len:331 (-) Transcript_24153:47-1039(-)